jgi:hypothetical protein
VFAGDDDFDLHTTLTRIHKLRTDSVSGTEQAEPIRTLRLEEVLASRYISLPASEITLDRLRRSLAGGTESARWESEFPRPKAKSNRFSLLLFHA